MTILTKALKRQWRLHVLLPRDGSYSRGEKEIGEEWQFLDYSKHQTRQKVSMGEPVVRQYYNTIACLQSRIKLENRVRNYSVYIFPIAFQVINYTNLCLTILHTICFLNFNIWFFCLQIWGFETIPSVLKLAPHMKYYGPMCPRMVLPSECIVQ